MFELGRPRIVVVGSSNTDMVVQAEHLPTPGETVLGGNLLTVPGGKGANQAVAASRLGAQVTLVARVGVDSLGDKTIENLRREGIVTRCISRDSAAPSGAALIFVDAHGENMIAVAPGANSNLSEADLEVARTQIDSADLLLVQMEIPMETIRCAVELASHAGVPVVLNPAPAAPLEGSLLKKVDILTPNRSEAEILTGSRLSDDASIKRAAQTLKGKGVSRVVITLGSEGCLVADEEPFEFVPGLETSAKDTTAAGDAFNGALACAYSAGIPLAEAARFANRAAAVSVTRMGAQSSLPTLEEIQQLRTED